MRAEMIDTGARSQERAGEKCVFYLTETYCQTQTAVLQEYLVQPRAADVLNALVTEDRARLSDQRCLIEKCTFVDWISQLPVS